MSDKTKSRIPEFANYREEAEFWDTHDFTEFDDETRPVEVKFSKHLSKTIQVRIAPDVHAQLEEEANRVGVGTSTLARMWILERLRGAEPVHQGS